MNNIKPHWQGEVQFRRYSDTSSQGQQIVFAVADREALEPFVHMAGKRFMAVFVEIGDDEQPVQERRKDKRGPLCREAVDLCHMPKFQEWVRERADLAGVPSLSSARDAILGFCGIESRKELDTNPEAAKRFIDRIRLPFMRHMQGLK